MPGKIKEINLCLILIFIAAVIHSFGQAVCAENLSNKCKINSVKLVISSEQRDRLDAYADIFRNHLKQRIDDVNCSIEFCNDYESAPETGELLIRAGIAASGSHFNDYLRNNKIDPPNANDPGPEGFVLKIWSSKEHNGLNCIIAGSDARGVLFGFGKLLHLTELVNRAFYLPMRTIRTAPRYSLRAIVPQLKRSISPDIKEKTGARHWTKQEGIKLMESMLLNGANGVFGAWGSSLPINVRMHKKDKKKGVNLKDVKLAQKYGLDYIPYTSVNALGAQNNKDKWYAEFIGKKFKTLACPSIPEARKAMLDARELYLKQCPKLDHFVIKAGDIAHCECEKCQPWVKTYWNLAEDIAKLVRKYHPEAKIYVNNQGFQVKDNKWMFDIIHNQNPEWVDGYSYAPGGSENSNYGWVRINEKWDKYPGMYPETTFLKSRLFYLHPGQVVTAHMDITHWKRSQLGIPYIDPALSEVYHRRTFNARPERIEKALKNVFPYIDTMTGYSEGVYDNFNCYLMLRLLWNPDLTARKIAFEYFKYHCGTEAAEIMAEAVFIGEDNYEQKVLENAEGIEKFHRKVNKAYQVMPDVYRKNNWRIEMFLERAAIDLYILRKLQNSKKVYDDIMSDLRNDIENVDKKYLENIIKNINWPMETPQMRSLYRKAQMIDDKLNRLVGLRFHALLTMRKIDSIGILWLKKQLKKAINTQKKDEMRKIVKQTINYEAVDDDEFYDNCGTRDGQPHFVFSSGDAQGYYGTGNWPIDSRPSQRSYSYSFESQEGLKFNYYGLDTSSDYEITLTYPNPPGVGFAIRSPNEFEVYANGVKIGEVIPTGKGFDFFTFTVPEKLINSRNGNLTVQFRKIKGRSRSTCISEIWVRKAD